MTEYAKLEIHITDTFDWGRDAGAIGALPEKLREVRWLLFSRFDTALIGRTETQSHDTMPHAFRLPISSLMAPPRVIQQVKLWNDPLCYNYLINYVHNDRAPDVHQVRKYRTYIGRCKYGMCPNILLAEDRGEVEKVDDDWLDQECIKVGRIAED